MNFSDNERTILKDLIAAFMYSDGNATLWIKSTWNKYELPNFDINVLPVKSKMYLHYEPASNIYIYTKMDSDGNVVEIPFTEEEKQLFSEKLLDVMVDTDVHIPTYENDTGYKLYSGLKQLSQIDDHFSIVPTICEHSVGKWNENKKDWEKVKAVILSDGSLRLDPDAICDSCFIFLSEEEWDAFPHPPVEYDSRCIMRYDFKTQTWKDARSLEQAKLHWENFIVNQEALLRSWAVSDILGIDSYNPITISAWNELVEACTQKINGSTSENEESLIRALIYAEDSVYAYIENMDMPVTDIDTYCKSVISKNENYKARLSRVSGEITAWKNIGNSIVDPTIAKYDSLQNQFADWVKLTYDKDVYVSSRVSYF